MKKRIAIIGLLLGSCLWATAQHKVEITPHKPQGIEVRLCDMENNFLLNLSLWFSITDKNILVVMIGNDAPMEYGCSVWLFSEEMRLVDLFQKDNNVRATKTFRKQNTVLNRFLLPHEKMTLQRSFDDGYEIIKKNTKPVFFEIINSSFKEALLFSLQFYVAQPGNSIPYLFVEKCKPIEIELIIK